MIAVVALEEDARVTLVAKLVDCAPERAHVGLPVRVEFKRVGESWMPQIRPRSGRAQLVAGTGRRAASVPPVRGGRFEDKVALTGIGRSPFGRRLLDASSTLAVQAARAAIVDAGLTPGDIDGMCGFPGADGLPGVSAGGIRELEQSLELHPSWHCAGWEGVGPAGAVLDAMLAVASGLCRHVLCFTVVSSGVGSWPVGGDDGEALSDGALTPGIRVALAASEYLARYAAGREALGWVAIAARRHAARNPDALCRELIDMDGYLAADLVSSPLGVLDCGVACDGAVALVVSAAEYASDRPHRPIWVDAVGTRYLPGQLWEAGLDSYRRVIEQPAAHLWSRASILPQDVDFIAVDDSFTFNALCWLEALGFCGQGEAAEFVAGGRRIGPDGVLPMNPHGGQLAAGRGNGFDNLYEAVLQLRGHAESRQIPSARVAVACSGDTESANAMLLLAEH
jgi:acetyl-CoA acetyltransferase